MSELEHWKTLERRLLVDRRPWMQLFEDDVSLPDGRIVQGYLRLETPGYAIIVPLNMAGEIGLVRSYKRGVGEVDLQPPAGVIDFGEDPQDSAERELLEELGCRTAQLVPLGSFVLSGNYFGGRAHVFLGLDCEMITEPDSGDLEEQQVRWLPYRETYQMWMRGDFQQLGTVAALGLAFSHIDQRIEDGSLMLGGNL